MSTIFAGLPSELIMRIIREADGGINTHKKKSADYRTDIAKLAKWRDKGGSWKMSCMMESISYIIW